ncbi:MAG: type IV toxin-antitoxin system AbiEi family antitoxin [Gammaproteobacteria bacterium]|nr:type IV toxin-antitoxin system AbiEi family antitoxin [Gammaproteobacteria bacterium]
MSKINQLFKYSKSGMILTLPWLTTLDISYKDAWKYTQSKWLERVGEKAYKKIDDEVSWIGGISAVQYQLNLPVHVGGKTSLQLLGRAHFIPVQGVKEIYLFMRPKTKLPKWISEKVFKENTFKVCRTSLFNNDQPPLGLIEREFDGIKIFLANPERAILELLYLVPKKQTFEEAFLLMEGLTNLRPDMVQILLENCNSIKVKRLFLYMAEKNNHPWLPSLDLKKIDLGSGKRMIGEGGGVYDSKYKLSIPKIDIQGNG